MTRKVGDRAAQWRAGRPGYGRRRRELVRYFPQRYVLGIGTLAELNMAELRRRSQVLWTAPPVAFRDRFTLPGSDA